MLKLSGKETVFDLYCGIGTIGICASDKAKKLVGIETIPEAIEDARENAKLNNIQNAEFLVRRCGKSIARIYKTAKCQGGLRFCGSTKKRLRQNSAGNFVRN